MRKEKASVFFLPQYLRAFLLELLSLANSRQIMAYVFVNYPHIYHYGLYNKDAQMCPLNYCSSNFILNRMELIIVCYMKAVFSIILIDIIHQ